ncbi:hypothetical protein F5Y10DRAFT_236670 [Nemania abortiva]|nr:hypothetical protein F5Y10DRAFT_236670 [Nemania abortiva]
MDMESGTGMETIYGLTAIITVGFFLFVPCVELLCPRPHPRPGPGPCPRASRLHACVPISAGKSGVDDCLVSTAVTVAFMQALSHRRYGICKHLKIPRCLWVTPYGCCCCCHYCCLRYCDASTLAANGQKNIQERDREHELANGNSRRNPYCVIPGRPPRASPLSFDPRDLLFPVCALRTVP